MLDGTGQHEANEQHCLLNSEGRSGFGHRALHPRGANRSTQLPGAVRSRRVGNSQLEAEAASHKQLSVGRVRKKRPEQPVQAAVIRFNIINNRLQASLGPFSASSCILLTACFPVISPAIELPKNLFLYAEKKASPLC